MHGWETRMRLRHCLDQGMSKAELSRRFGISERRSTAGGSRRGSWTGICRSARHRIRRARRCRTSWIPTRGSSTRGWRCSPGCPCSGCSTRCARRDTRAATAGCGTTCARCARASRPSPWSGTRRPWGARAGGLRDVHAAVGAAPRAAGGARPFAAGVAALLPPADDGRPDRRAGERVRARFGGVPRELLFDQMRAVVLSDDRSASGELVLNAEFLRFAAHWGSCRACAGPYRGPRPRARWSGRSAT